MWSLQRMRVLLRLWARSPQARGRPRLGTDSPPARCPGCGAHTPSGQAPGRLPCLMSWRGLGQGAGLSARLGPRTQRCARGRPGRSLRKSGAVLRSSGRWESLTPPAGRVRLRNRWRLESQVHRRFSAGAASVDLSLCHEASACLTKGGRFRLRACPAHLAVAGHRRAVLPSSHPQASVA